MDKGYFKIKRPRPICVGTGLVALDVLLKEEDIGRPHIWAGGSCGNVMAILAYLGWSSYPVALLGKDRPSRLVIDDMRRWGVKTEFISRTKKNRTPVVLERLSHNGGISEHAFEFKCPYCGSPFPRNKQLPLAFAMQKKEAMPSAQVFYFDRASRAALELARLHRSQGALVMFEPYKVRREKLFRECLAIAHVVKYSHEQVETRLSLGSTPLEIQTLGAEGLRYKLRNSAHSKGDWKKMQAYHLPKIVDSAGAGDWCTAGLIQVLGQGGCDGFMEESSEEIQTALRFGQSLAALCCGYEGPRGLMYYVKKEHVEISTLRFMGRMRHQPEIPRALPGGQATVFKYICSSCQGRRRSRISNGN